MGYRGRVPEVVGARKLRSTDGTRGGDRDDADSLESVAFSPQCRMTTG
jgi:hypothetical protein